MDAFTFEEVQAIGKSGKFGALLQAQQNEFEFFDVFKEYVRHFDNGEIT